MSTSTSKQNTEDAYVDTPVEDDIVVLLDAGMPFDSKSRNTKFMEAVDAFYMQRVTISKSEYQKFMNQKSCVPIQATFHNTQNSGSFVIGLAADGDSGWSPTTRKAAIFLTNDAKPQVVFSIDEAGVSTSRLHTIDAQTKFCNLLGLDHSYTKELEKYLFHIVQKWLQDIWNLVELEYEKYKDDKTQRVAWSKAKMVLSMTCMYASNK